MPTGNGWARLGDMIGGGLSDAERMDIQIKTQNALANRDVNVNRARQALMKTRGLEGADRSLATLFGLEPEVAAAMADQERAGFMPDKVYTALGRHQEQGYRDAAREAALAGDWARANANMLPVANAPQAVQAVQGGMLLGNRFDPNGPVVPTDVGLAGINADNALAAQREAAARVSNVRADAGGFAPRAERRGSGGGSSKRSASEAKAIIDAVQRQMKRRLTPEEIAQVYSGGDFSFADAPVSAAIHPRTPATRAWSPAEIAQTMADARKAVASGRITKEEAQRRLRAAGLDHAAGAL